MPPFANVPKEGLYRAVTSKKVAVIDPDRWSVDFQDFIDCCMRKDPKERYTFERLLKEHPFLKDIDVEASRQAWVRDY